MRYVLAPMPDIALFAQDYFVYELSEVSGYQLILNLHNNTYISPSTSPELIISHNPDHIADTRFIRQWGNEIPVVLHLHCHFKHFPEKSSQNVLSRISNGENIRECLRLASTVIVPSEYLINDLKENVPDFRPDLKFIVVYNGVRKSLFYPSSLSERK